MMNNMLLRDGPITKDNCQLDDAWTAATEVLYIRIHTSVNPLP
jgi:hypothetical protein